MCDKIIIGVGFDGDHGSREALRVAETLARASSATLWLRVVVELAPPRMPAGFGGPDIEQREREARALLHSALAQLEVPADGDVVVGIPGQALQALSQQVDLLVIGGARRRSVPPLVPAPTPTSLRHHAGCPVVVTPAAEPLLEHSWTPALAFAAQP